MGRGPIGGVLAGRVRSERQRERCNSMSFSFPRDDLKGAAPATEESLERVFHSDLPYRYSAEVDLVTGIAEPLSR
jgi:hypothetical protein